MTQREAPLLDLTLGRAGSKRASPVPSLTTKRRRDGHLEHADGLALARHLSGALAQALAQHERPGSRGLARGALTVTVGVAGQERRPRLLLGVVSSSNQRLPEQADPQIAPDQ